MAVWPSTLHRPLGQAARELDVGPDAIAIAAAIAEPWSDVVLSGAVSPAMLAGNLRALDIDAVPELPELAESADDYWSTRSSLAWS